MGGLPQGSPLRWDYYVFKIYMFEWDIGIYNIRLLQAITPEKPSAITSLRLSILLRRQDRFHPFIIAVFLPPHSFPKTDFRNIIRYLNPYLVRGNAR